MQPLADRPAMYVATIPYLPQLLLQDVAHLAHILQLGTPLLLDGRKKKKLYQTCITLYQSIASTLHARAYLADIRPNFGVRRSLVPLDKVLDTAKN